MSLWAGQEVDDRNETTSDVCILGWRPDLMVSRGWSDFLKVKYLFLFAHVF